MGTQPPPEQGLTAPEEGNSSGAKYPREAIGTSTAYFPAAAILPVEIEDAELTRASKASRTPLKLRVVNGPIPARERSRILAEYGRLTDRRIPIQTFVRCTEQSPEGPAIHGLLETSEGLVVGHCCLVPFRMNIGRRRLKVAKAEYFFVSEGYRSRAVEGLESSGRPAVVILLEQLYHYASQQGWGPLLASPSQGSQAVHRQAGCRLVEFRAAECFFVLNPARAWRRGSNLPAKHRRRLFLAGLAQRALSSVVLPLTYDAGLVKNPRIGEDLPSMGSRDDSRLSLAEAEDFLRWRYPDDAYSRFVLSDGSPGYAIVQKAGHGDYLRVYQACAPANGRTSSLITELIRQANWSRAIGVRWSVYGGGPEQRRMVAQLRKLGFFCVRELRRVAVYTSEPEFLSPDKWNLSDSVFTLEELYPDPAFT